MYYSSVTNYLKRKDSEGNEFFVLEIMDEVEVIKSKQSDQYYATSRKTSVQTTFNKTMCKSLVGITLPGAIEKVPVETYDHVLADGEVIELDFTYQYNPKKV